MPRCVPVVERAVKKGELMSKVKRTAKLMYLSVFMLGVLGASSVTAADGVSVELNRLQALEKGCRMHLVLNNASAVQYQGFQLDLVLFDSDGVINSRMALEAAPIRANKTSVLAFDMVGLSCDRFGSVLLNDITACIADAKPAEGCVDAVNVSSRNDKVPFRR